MSKKPESLSNKTVILGVRITPLLREELEFLAQREGRTMSGLATHALRQYIARAALAEPVADPFHA